MIQLKLESLMKPPQVSLAETNKLLSYSLLQEELGISTVRELEDLIIEVGGLLKNLLISHHISGEIEM